MDPEDIKPKIRILIVDAVKETIDSLRKLLYFERDMQVVGSATDASEGVKLAQLLQPDVVLMDINFLSGPDGIPATQAITQSNPQIKVIMITTQTERRYMRRAWRAGAWDYLVKPFGSEQLLTAIRREHRPTRWEGSLLESPAPPPPTPPPRLPLSPELKEELMLKSDAVSQQLLRSIFRDILKKTEPPWAHSSPGQHSRVLHFPEPIPNSTLYMRDWRDPGETTWERIGEPRGAVEVPAGKWLGLVVSEMTMDLSPLNALHPDDLQEIDFSHSLAWKSELVHVRGLTGLKMLKLEAEFLVDLGHIRELGGLEVLIILGAPVLSDQLKNVSGLTRLKCLVSPSSWRVSLEPVRELTALRILDLGWVYPDANLVHLDVLTALEYLSLGGTAVSDVGLTHLQPLTALRFLYLRNSPVTDAGLENLKGLTALEWLNLSGTHVSDAGLVHLEDLTQLKKLYLFGTQVSDAGVDGLRRALPQCHVVK